MKDYQKSCYKMKNNLKDVLKVFFRNQIRINYITLLFKLTYQILVSVGFLIKILFSLLYFKVIKANGFKI